jgi:hypothetical protein
VPIYWTLEWMRLISTYQFHFRIRRVEVSQEPILVFNQMREGVR